MVNSESPGIDDITNMGVSKSRGVTPKMDDLQLKKTYLKWMIWRENPLFSETSI